MTMQQRLAFLGLGVMGYPMAGHLARAGHRVTVYNRTEAKAKRWVAEYGGTAAASPAEASRDAELVMMCVGNDNDVRAVALCDNGALAGMSTGAILVDHTTASAAVARELASAARAKGIGFLDVISNGAAQSWQMENRGTTMVADQFDFGFAVDWMRKDLAICLAEARANGAALPVIALLDQFYARIQARGGGRWDTSSLMRLLRDIQSEQQVPRSRSG